MTGPKITGTTRLYAIVGDPIAQVRSPEVFTERFANAGIDAVLVPAQVAPERFDQIIPALMGLGNLDGLLVTLPFKARMMPFASRLGVTAKCIRALNALRRERDGSWTGDMFDGAGFVRGALRKGARLADRRVLLFGAGGAGSAIACALCEAGVESIAIVDPEAARVSALVYALRDAFPARRVTAGAGKGNDVDMIVNATPVGMQPGDAMPGDVGPLAPDTLVGDVVISASPTPLIRHALRYGCPWVNGRDMHAGQVDALMGFFAPGAACAEVA